MIPPHLAKLGSRMGLASIIVVLLVALLVVQTIRLEGFELWPVSIEGVRPKADRLQREIDDFDNAHDDALSAAMAAKAATERRYQELAERIDNDAEQARVGHLDDAERYIVANRMQRCPADRSAAGRAPAPAADDGAGYGEAAGPAAKLDAAELVTVPASDVRICTTNTLQAEAGRVGFGLGGAIAGRRRCQLALPKMPETETPPTVAVDGVSNQGRASPEHPAPSSPVRALRSSLFGPSEARGS